MNARVQEFYYGFSNKGHQKNKNIFLTQLGKYFLTCSETSILVEENVWSTIMNQLVIEKKKKILQQDCNQHHSETWALAHVQFESSKHHSQQELRQEASKDK